MLLRYLNTIKQLLISNTTGNTEFTVPHAAPKCQWKLIRNARLELNHNREMCIVFLKMVGEVYCSTSPFRCTLNRTCNEDLLLSCGRGRQDILPNSLLTYSAVWWYEAAIGGHAITVNPCRAEFISIITHVPVHINDFRGVRARYVKCTG